MSVSCAVYGFPLLLDSKLDFEDAYGTVDERLVDCEDFAAFQDFNSVSSSDYDQALDRRFFSLFDEQHMDFSQGSHPKDSGILLEQGFELTFVDNNCCKSTTSTVECHPAFDLSPEEHKDQNLEWMDTAPNMTLDWPQEQQQSIMMPEERESQTAMVQGTDEQYWFPCPQLEGQVLPQQQNALHDQPDVYGFKQLCSETFENISVNDPGNLALQVHFGNVEFCEQQEKADDQKANRPVSKPTNGRSRSARKRRSLPYQVPFPCCTSRKSVEELIAEKNLEFLLQKELKPSDVGNLGRIVLPKKEAESALPYLTVREGMTMIMEDLTTAYKWHMRYRFWPNNKSRMYLLENTGEWIRSHCLKEGDFLRLYKYRDSNSDKYVILGKKASSLPDMGCNKIVKSVRSKRVKRKNAEESSSGSEESLCQF